MTYGDDFGQPQYPQQGYGQFPPQPQQYWPGQPQQYDTAPAGRVQSHTKPLPQYVPPQPLPPASWAARHKVLTGVFVFAGLGSILGVAIAVGSSSSPTGASASPAAGTTTAAASDWYPQAVPDSALPDPNRPANSFGSALAIAAKLGWQSSFSPGSTIVNGSLATVNAAGELFSYPEAGETILEVNQNNGQELGTDEDIWTFSSPAQEQAFAASAAQGSADGNVWLALLGPGWAIGLDDVFTGNLTYAQGIIGGSLVTWFEGGVHGALDAYS